MKNLFYRLLLIVCLAIVNLATIDKVYAQNLERFQNEVDTIVERYAQYGKKSRNDTFTTGTNSEQILAVFTGSSSVSLWASLSDDFPELMILNTGFGGSTYAELFHYRDELIGQYNPDMVIIYEGDNDVTGSDTVDEIFTKAKELYSYLTQELPETKVYILAAKPSPLRWNLKPLYDTLNTYFADFAAGNDQFSNIDIWNPMLGENGKPMPSISLLDSLNMNEAGYLIWKQTIAPFLQVSK